MIRSIIRSSLKFQFVAVAVAAALLVVGVLQLRQMPVDVLPEYSVPYVEIQTEALGLSPAEVEQLITLGLEQDLLNGLPWLDSIHSESAAGLSDILLVFKPGTDLYRARQMVSERMTQAFALPHVSKPPTMIQPVSSASRFMIVGLSSKKLSLVEMSVLARWTIAPRLVGVPGVANVAIWGQRDRQIQVQVDPKRLEDSHVSLLQVLETTGNALWVSSLSFVEASTPGTGGFIDTTQQRLGIRHISPIVTSNTLAQVPIEGAPGVVIGDVANVVEDHQPLIGDALTEKGSGLLLIIQKFPSANTLEVTKGVEDALSELRPGLSGMELDSTIFRPADFIEAAIRNLGVTLLIGFLLILLVLVAFFFEWRTVFVSLITIPLALVAAVYVLYLRGITFNIMILAGLVAALGVIIDDTITLVENVSLRLHQDRKEGNLKPIASVILDAALEMRGPIFYSLVILLLAAASAFLIKGLASAFFQPLALSYVLAVLASMLVTLTVTPALCLIVLGEQKVERRASPLVLWLQRGYESVLSQMVQRGRIAFIVLLVLTLVSLAALPSLKQTLLPSFKERDLLIHLEGAPGASQPEMSRISGRISAELQAIPGVSNVAVQVGRAIFGDQVVGINSAELWVSMDHSANYDQTVAAIQKVINGYPGVHHKVDTYLNELSSEVSAEKNKSLVVRVYGATDKDLRSAAESVKTAVADIRGVAGANIQLPVQEPGLEIEVNLEAARSYGLKPGDVRRAAAIMFSGLQVGSLFQEQKVFDVVVWSTPDTRKSLSDIRNLLIDTPSRKRVRLGDIATVRVVSSPSVIRHDQVKRYVDIGIDVQGRSVGAVAADLKSRLKQGQLPMEVHAEVLGGYADPQGAWLRMFIFVAALALGIFLILESSFASWRLALVVLLTLPMALAGGVLTVYLSGSALSLGSLVGFLTVFGITLRNSMILFNRYHQLEINDGEAFEPQLIVHGSLERLAPILMTALALGLALVPTLIVGTVPGLEIIRPMAIVILGSLATSTWLNLFVLPALYWRYGASRERDRELVSVPVADFPAPAADD
ncbi:MAG TPA: efflux RND transporter permease subunit [Anaerolineales bacterium]|nr:efflux RND transporter permease subunit [Anaerolineales bacterium]